MATDDRPLAIHATAIAIAGRALLIIGPSRAGKSRLAWSMIEASTPARPIVLVGDDRILLSPAGGSLIARGHPRIQGFIERCGLGIVACPFVESAPVGGIVELEPVKHGPTTPQIAVLQNFPCLRSVESSGPTRDAVLAWWRDPSTTQVAKASAAA